MIAEQVSLRPTLPEDSPFLLAVYASTRAEEMALVPWSADQRQAFVQMQFDAQRQHYAVHFPQAQYSIIQKEQTPIGRLIINRAADQILLMDITLLPHSRNSGIGTALIENLMGEARQAGLPLRLHVEAFNPALRLYQRLGFTRITEMGIYIEMEWIPDHAEKHRAHD